jgi:hypothetical protein
MGVAEVGMPEARGGFLAAGPYGATSNIENRGAQLAVLFGTLYPHY